MVLYFIFFAKRMKYLAVLMIALTVWNAGWLLFQREAVYAGGQPVRFFLSAYCLEFFVGLMLSEIRKKYKLPKELLPIWITMAIIGLSIGTTSEMFAAVEIMRVGSFGIFGIGCCLMALTLDQNSISPGKNSTLIRIGNASYSIYLLHPVLFDLFGVVRLRLMFLPSLLLSASVLASTVLIIIFCYYWYAVIEHPLYKKLGGRA